MNDLMFFLAIAAFVCIHGQGPYYTIADAFKAYAKSVVKVPGVANCSTSDESGIPAAAAAAKTADTVVLAVGTDLTIAAVRVRSFFATQTHQLLRFVPMCAGGQRCQKSHTIASPTVACG